MKYQSKKGTKGWFVSDLEGNDVTGALISLDSTTGAPFLSQELADELATCANKHPEALDRLAKSSEFPRDLFECASLVARLLAFRLPVDSHSPQPKVPALAHENEIDGQTSYAPVKISTDRMTDPPIKEGYFVSVVPIRWKRYKPDGQRQMKALGRWQIMNEWGGWNNCEFPSEVWESPPALGCAIHWLPVSEAPPGEFVILGHCTHGKWFIGLGLAKHQSGEVITRSTHFIPVNLLPPAPEGFE